MPGPAARWIAGEPAGVAAFDEAVRVYQVGRERPRFPDMRTAVGKALTIPQSGFYTMPSHDRSSSKCRAGTARGDRPCVEQKVGMHAARPVILAVGPPCQRAFLDSLGCSSVHKPLG